MNIIRKNTSSLSLNRQGQVESARVRYVIDHAQKENPDNETMLSHVLANAPEKFGSADVAGIELGKSCTSGIFEAEVIYLTPATAAPDAQKRAARRHGERIWSSKCSVAKEKCFETLERQESFPADGIIHCSAGHSAVWNGRFGTEADVDGVDKLVPRCEEECRKFILASQCGNDFRKKIINLVGKLNSGSFHGWSSKEVMLTKLEISEPFVNDLDQKLVEISCTFSIRRHRTKVDWCGIDVGKVKGWDHLWGTFYADPVDRTLKGNCAYVGRLYDTADFGILSLED